MVKPLKINPEFMDYIEGLGVDSQACTLVALATQITELSAVDTLDWLLNADKDEVHKQLQMAIKALCILEDANEYVLRIPLLVDSDDIVDHYNKFKEEFIARGWNSAGSPNAKGGITKFKWNDDTCKIVNNIFSQIELDWDKVFAVLGDYYHSSENQYLLNFQDYLVNNFLVDYKVR